MFSRLLNTILPARCLICQQPAQDELSLCIPCHEKLPYNDCACVSCAQALPHGGMTCGRCQQYRPYYNQVISVLRYKGEVRQLILDLKFQGKLRNARLLAKLFHAQLQGRRAEVMVPVPLHPKRIKTRGYNQSLELAKELSKLTGIPVNSQSTRRNRHTERQASLSLKDKKGNVKNAFEVIDRFSERHVAIVDDVMTSGHTVNEFARILRRSGIDKVDVWAVSRAG